MYKRYVKQLGRRFCNFFSGQKRPSAASGRIGAGENIFAKGVVASPEKEITPTVPDSSHRGSSQIVYIGGPKFVAFWQAVFGQSRPESGQQGDLNG